MNKRRTKKAVRKWLLGRPITQNERWAIDRHFRRLMRGIHLGKRVDVSKFLQTSGEMRGAITRLTSSANGAADAMGKLKDALWALCEAEAMRQIDEMTRG